MIHRGRRERGFTMQDFQGQIYASCKFRLPRKSLRLPKYRGKAGLFYRACYIVLKAEVCRVEDDNIVLRVIVRVTYCRLARFMYIGTFMFYNIIMIRVKSTYY